jgi:hypothetical protein
MEHLTLENYFDIFQNRHNFRVDNEWEVMTKFVFSRGKAQSFRSQSRLREAKKYFESL